MAHNVLVFCNSMLSYCHVPNHADILAVRGATVQTLINKVKSNIINWQNYDLTIIHVGTNDVDNGNSESILENIITLCNEITERKRLMQFIISAIIPRPKDFAATDTPIKKVNRDLKRWCRNRPSFYFHPSYNTFQRFGWPDILGNYWHSDDLHLATRGIKRMNAVLKNLVARWRNGTL